VVEVVSQHGGGVVEEGCDGVVVALEVGGGEDFGEEVGVVAPAGFDEEFLVCGALRESVVGRRGLGGAETDLVFLFLCHCDILFVCDGQTYAASDGAEEGLTSCAS
jgi:hypothetical protein